jgi:hypothetical protein
MAAGDPETPTNVFLRRPRDRKAGNDSMVERRVMGVQGYAFTVKRVM